MGRARKSRFISFFYSLYIFLCSEMRFFLDACVCIEICIRQRNAKKRETCARNIFICGIVKNFGLALNSWNRSFFAPLRDSQTFDCDNSEPIVAYVLNEKKVLRLKGYCCNLFDESRLFSKIFMPRSVICIHISIRTQWRRSL